MIGISYLFRYKFGMRHVFFLSGVPLQILLPPFPFLSIGDGPSFCFHFDVFLTTFQTVMELKQTSRFSRPRREERFKGIHFLSETFVGKYKLEMNVGFGRSSLEIGRY